MKKILLPLAAISFLFSCTAEPSPEDGESAEEAVVTQEDEAFDPGMTIVEFDDDMLSLIGEDLADGKIATRSMALNSAMDELGIESMEREFPDAGEYEASQREFGLHRFYKVTFKKDQPLTKAVATLEGVPGVISAEKHRRPVLRTFNDPDLSKQWGLKNDGSGNRKVGADINVEPVWEQFTTGRSDVIVAVVDGGIDMSHEDLAANVIAAGKNGSKNFVDDNYVIKAHDHGTHVAGIIGAVNNNNVGVCGIAGGDNASRVNGVKLLSCQIFETQSSGSDKGGDECAAIVWAAQHGAVIAQNSWGYSPDDNNDGKISSDEMAEYREVHIPTNLKSAIDYFIKYAGCDGDGNQLSSSPVKGGVVIFAAGNDNIDYDPICDYEPVIAVGSMTEEGQKSSFSNHGDWVDICAPGSGIYSTVPNGKYKTMSGTSMACPHVSGVAALIASYYGGQGFTADALKDKLLKGANTSIVPSGAKIGPLADALGSLTYGGSSKPDQVSTYTAQATSNNIEFTWAVTGYKRKVKAYGFMLMASEDKADLEKINPRNPDPSVKHVFVQTPSDATIGSSISDVLTDLEFDTDYYVTIAACDYASNYSAISDIKKVRTTVNNPPVIEGDASAKTIHMYQTITVPVKISDPDGHSFKVSLEDNSGAAAISTSVEKGYYNIVITGKLASAGKYSLTVTAVDSYGMSTSWKLNYEILENQKPVLVKQLDNVFSTQLSEVLTYDATQYFSDGDGEPLVYSIEISNQKVAHLTSSESTFYLTTLGYGLSTVTVTAKDAMGESVTTSFKVLVRDPAVAYSAYPNPVDTFLNVGTGAVTESTQIKIVSSTGSVIIDKTEQVSAFDPMQIDMSTCAPGKYTMSLKFGGKEYKQTIVKK